MYAYMVPDEHLLFVSFPLKTKVISIENNSQEATLLKRLKAFMEYYVYVKVRFVNEKGKKSAPSEVQGPRIVKTPARGMSSVLPDSCTSILDRENSFVCALETLGDVT